MLAGASCKPSAPTSEPTAATATLAPLPTATTPLKTASYVDLKAIGTLGKGILPQITHSSDGSITVISDGYIARLLKDCGCTEIASIPLSDDGYGAVGPISPNNRLIIKKSLNGFTVVDIKTQKELVKGSGGNGSTRGDVFTPDSKSVVFLATDSTSGGPYFDICLLDTTAPQKTYDDYSGSCYPLLHGQRYHTMTTPALSPDGKLVAAGYDDSTNDVLYIWNTYKNTIRFELKEQPARITSVNFSPDGSLLATSSEDGLVKLWDPATGKIRRTITGFTDHVEYVEFTPDGRGLIVSVVDQPDVIYNLASGKITPAQAPALDPLAKKMLQEGYLLPGTGSKILFSPNGKNVAVGHGGIQVWDVQTSKLVAALSSDEALSITGMTYSPDGNHLAVITSQGNVYSWDISTSKRELDISVHPLSTGQVLLAIGGNELGPGIGAGGLTEQGIAYSPDGKLLAVGNGAAIELYDPNTNSKVLTLEQTQPATHPTSVSFSADGKYVYAALNRNRDAAVWDALSGKLLRRLNLPRVDPNAFTATALRGALFARNNYDDKNYWIELWNLETDEMIRVPTPVNEVEPLRFSTDGRYFSAVVNHSDLYVWRADTGQLVFVTDKMDAAGDLALSPDAKTLATASYGKVTLWDVGSYTKSAFAANFVPLAPLPSPTPYSAVGSSDYPTETPQPTQPVQRLPVATLEAGAINTKNAGQLRQVASFGNGTINQLSWPDNRILVSTSQGAYEFDSQTLTETNHFETENIWSEQSRFLPDGRILLAGTTFDGRVQVWDSQTNSMLLELPGVGASTISPDGKWLVFANATSGLETWNIETRQAGALLHSKWYSLSSTVFSPDGKLVAAKQGDRSIRVWDLATGVVVNGVGGPEGPITDMSFSADGKYIVGAAGGSAWVWSMAPSLPPLKISFYEGRINRNLTLFDNTVTAVAMDTHDSLIAIGTSEHIVWLYDRKSLRALAKLEGDTGAPSKLSFNLDGTRLVSIDRDGKMIVWDLTTEKPVLTSQTLHGPVVGLVTRKDGDISAWGVTTVWKLNYNTIDLKQTTYVPAGKVLAASPLGDLVAGYTPWRVSIYDANNGELKKTFAEDAVDVSVPFQLEGQVLRQFYGAVFSPDGKQLATLGTGGIWLYNLPGGDLRGHAEGNNSGTAAFSPDGKWLLGSLEEIGFGSCPSLFDTKNATPIFQLCSLSNFSQETFSPDKRWIGSVVNGWNTSSYLFITDTSTGQLTQKLAFEKVKLVSLAFNPDASLIAIGQADGKIVFIDPNTMKILTTIQAHKSGVIALVFSLDSKSLISVGHDGVAKSWSVP